MDDDGFAHIATLTGDVDTALAAIRDIACLDIGGRHVLYTLSQQSGTVVSAYEMTEDGTLTLLEQIALADGPLMGVSPQISVFHGVTGPALMVSGLSGPPLTGITLSATGEMGALHDIGGFGIGGLAHVVSFTGPDGPGIYGAMAGTNSIVGWTQAGDGGFGLAGDPAPQVPGGPAALGALSAYGAGFVMAVSGEDALHAYRVGTDGVLTLTDTLTAAAGPGIGGAQAMATAVVEDSAFAIVGGAGSSSLSVIALAPDGSLSVTDHLIDGLGSRFADVQEVRSFTIGSEVWLAACGSDDGFSLLRLLPGGQLVHVAALADTHETALSGLTGLDLAEFDGRLQVLTASMIENGMSWLGITLPNGRVAGSAADDVLTAPDAGAILTDGAGTDTMFGGDGVDLFVLSTDGVLDEIRDFDPAQDRIDLSYWTFFRSPAQLDLIPLADGGEIRFGDEVLRIRTVDHTPLSEAQMAALADPGPTHLLPEWVAAMMADQTPLALDGTPGGDVMEGAGGDDMLRGFGGSDTLDGQGGNDTLEGKGGFDVLNGGAGDDTLSGNAGNDSLDGGDGADVLNGGIGWDLLSGGEGHDLIEALDGFDTLLGGGGQDTLNGNNGSDSLDGGAGDDVLNGGLGADTLLGQGGEDLLIGRGGADLMLGGAGDDTLNGNAWFDTLYGGDGNDVLSGGYHPDLLSGDAGHDSLYGGDGRDTLDGGAGDDHLSGNAGPDHLSGGTGHDTLEGGEGRDTLLGGDGDDVLWGMSGPDILTGGGGADHFVFSEGTDTITDFEDGIDTLVLSSALFGGAPDLAAALGAAHAGGGGVVLDFGAAGHLTILGIDVPASLGDDLDFF